MKTMTASAKDKTPVKKNTGKTSASPTDFNSKLPYWTVFIISILIYSNTLFFGYALDDDLLINNNKITKKGLKGIPEILTTDAFRGVFGDSHTTDLPGGRYRPLSQIMFAVEYQFFGANPFIGHLLNVLIYSMLCLLLLKILTLLFKNIKSTNWYLSIPFIATLIFATHPLHTEVVANIKGRDELLAYLGAFGSLYYSIKFIDTKKILLLVLSFVSIFFGLLSKESAVTFLALIPLTIFFFRKTNVKNYLLLMIPLVVATGIYMVLRLHALGLHSISAQNKELMNNPFVDATAVQKYATIIYTWGKYLLLLVFPHPLTHDYYPKQIPLMTFGNFQVWLSIIVNVALILFALLFFKKKSIPAFGILIYYITFSVASNLIFNIGTFMNERFMFAPLLGFALFIAYFFEKLTNNSRLYWVSLVIFFFVIMAYSAKSITRNTVWKNNYTLFKTDVKTSTNSAKIRVGVAEVLLKSINEKTSEENKQEKISEALTHLTIGLQIYPKFKAGWIYKGYAYVLRKDYEASRIALAEALKIDSNNYDANYYLKNTALECYNHGNPEQAIRNYKTLLHFLPGNKEYQLMLAEIFSNNGKADSALILLENMNKKYPDDSKVLNKMGEIYGRVLQDFPNSFKYLLLSYKINPNDIDNLRNLGTAYAMKSQYNEALKYLSEAEKIKPDDADVLNKLALTYKNMGNLPLYQEYAVKIQKLTNSGKN